MTDSIKYLLEESKAPKFWHNINSDLPVLHLHHCILELSNRWIDDFAPLFPMSLIMQEVSTEREIEIPNLFERYINNGGHHLYYFSKTREVFRYSRKIGHAMKS